MHAKQLQGEIATSADQKAALEAELVEARASLEAAQRQFAKGQESVRDLMGRLR